MSLWEYIYPPFKFPKGHKIRLFEAFSGIGCQAMALKRITQDYELVGFSEIDKYAIQSYRAIHGEVKNYGDITKMESIPSCDIFTYSFPCTDLSKAGKQAGLGKETRSGLVYEVLRLLKATEDKPKVLIMENVVDLVQVNFVKQFNEIQYELEKLGYRNYNEVLNAKDYGIPQNRERVFMVSILGDYSYEFPEKVKLKLRLKDLLEANVSEKYYLSGKQLSQIQAWKSYQNPLDNILGNESVSPTITTRVAETDAGGISASMILLKEPCVDVVGNYMPSGHKNADIINPQGIAPTVMENHGTVNAVLEKIGQLPGYESNGRIYDEKGLSPTINTMGGGNREPKIAIPEDNAQGYSLAGDGDGVYINRPEQKRGCVQKGMIQTIKCDGQDIGVVTNNLRIRKLTERECWRLMGISDSDFDKAQASGVSRSQLYKQAGNGICVPVFEAILRGLIQ